MFNDSQEDAANKLPTQSTGEFHAIQDGKVNHIKADASLIQAKQVPREKILILASKKPGGTISAFVSKTKAKAKAIFS